MDTAMTATTTMSMRKSFGFWFLAIVYAVCVMVSPQGWVCQAKVDDVPTRRRRQGMASSASISTANFRKKGATRTIVPNDYRPRHLKSGKGSSQNLCSNSDAIYRTCATNDTAGGKGKGGKGRLSLSLTRSSSGELEGDGIVPPDNASDGFTLQSVNLTIYAVAEADADLPGELEKCKRLLRAEASLLEYLVDGFTTSDQVFRCAALINVATSSIEDIDVEVQVTAMTSTVSVEWSDDYLASLQDEACDALTLLPCCLQNEINEDGVRDVCADNGCDLTLCSAMTVADTLDSDCDASDGLLEFLQCAAKLLDGYDDDDGVSVEVILGTAETTVVANCVALRETIRDLGDNEDNAEICELYFSLGCGILADLNDDDVLQLCPASPPLTSTLLDSTPELLCTNIISPQDFANFPESILTAWTQGRQEGGEFYYAVGQVNGATRLYTLQWGMELDTGGGTYPYNCGILAVKSCELTGLSVEGIREATSLDPSGGGPTLYIAGVDSGNSPFLRRIDTDCNVVPSTGGFAGEFTLTFDDDSDNDLPFFDGLAVNPVSGASVWTASQTSLYPPAPDTVRGDNVQYFLTRFSAASGLATGQYKYFAEEDAVLTDILCLDDYASFFTVETGPIPEGVTARTPLPTTAPAPTPEPTPFFPAVTNPPTAFQTLPMLPAPGKQDKPKGTKKDDKNEDKKKKKAKKDKDKDEDAIGTCFYRTYADASRLDVGVTRKTLIECIADEEYIAAAHGFGNLERAQRRRRRRLQSTRVCTSTAEESPCIRDTYDISLLTRKKDDSDFIDVAASSYTTAETHFGQCGSCGTELNTEVGGSCTRGSVDTNDIVSSLVSNANSAGKRAEAIEARALLGVSSQSDINFMSKRCRKLAIGLRDDFDSNAQDCIDSSSCPLGNGDVEFWQTVRSSQLQRCCRQ